MKKIIAFVMALSLGFGLAFAGPKKGAAPVNDKCPFSGKAVNKDETVQVGVCCGNCAKKAAKDVKGLLSKAAGDFSKCPFSGKAAKKKVTVGFCCGNCKGKASKKS